MKQNSHVLLCRVQFCQRCYDNQYPTKNLLFVTIGRKKQTYLVRLVLLFGTRGFTPHIIQMIQSANGLVRYSSYCSINGCGCDITVDEDSGSSLISPTNMDIFDMPIREWNHMVLYTKDSDYFLD